MGIRFLVPFLIPLALWGSTSYMCPQILGTARVVSRSKMISAFLAEDFWCKRPMGDRKSYLPYSQKLSDRHFLAWHKARSKSSRGAKNWKSNIKHCTKKRGFSCDLLSHFPQKSSFRNSAENMQSHFLSAISEWTFLFFWSIFCVSKLAIWKVSGLVFF